MLTFRGDAAWRHSSGVRAEYAALLDGVSAAVLLSAGPVGAALPTALFPARKRAAVRDEKGKTKGSGGVAFSGKSTVLRFSTGAVSRWISSAKG